MASPLDLFTAIPAAYGYEWDLPTAAKTVGRIVNPSQAVAGDVANTLQSLPAMKQPSYADMSNAINGRMGLYGIETNPEKQTASPIVGATLPGAPQKTMGGVGESSVAPNQVVLDAIKTVQNLKQGFDNLQWTGQNAAPQQVMSDTTTLPGPSGIWKQPDGSYTNAPTQSGADFLPQFSGNTPSTGGWTQADVANSYNKAMASALNSMSALPNTEAHAGSVAQAQKTLAALAGFNPLMKPQIADTAAGHVSTEVPFGGQQKTIKDNIDPYIRAQQINADAVKSRVDEASKMQNLRIKQHSYDQLTGGYQKEMAKIDEEAAMGDTNAAWGRKRAVTTKYLTSLGVPADIAAIPYSEDDYLFLEQNHAKAIGKPFGDKERKAASEFYTKVARPRLEKEHKSAYENFFK